ncbi:ZNF653 isoform 3, partial [Pongo abelii]
GRHGWRLRLRGDKTCLRSHRQLRAELSLELGSG